MKLLGLNITRQKAVPAGASAVAENRGGWFPLIRESFAGAWQRNVKVDRNLVLSYHAVYACVTLIASDIAKLRVKLVQQDDSGVWNEVTNPAYSPVLRRPNRYQNRIQFWENWILSKLMAGNTFVLKQRNNRGSEDNQGNVVALYILDPHRVTPLVADDGSVWYRLNTDNLSGLQEGITVPASEIIHDRMNCLFHPLIGTSPIYAAGVPATQGLNIQNNSAWFFANKSQPGGMLTAPGNIPKPTADRLKEAWQANYSGENAGTIAVAGDGLKYESLALSAHDSQLIEQLKWTAEVICSTFHVPPYKIGVGQMPTNNNVQSLNVEYYSQCLQSLIEQAEECLDEGLGIGWKEKIGIEFDVDNLLRMDTLTQMDVLNKSAGILEVDEMRGKLGLKKTPGGNAVYLQQQNFSLPALAKRDAKDDPFEATKKPVAPTPDETQAANDNAIAAAAKDALFEIWKGLG